MNYAKRETKKVENENVDFWREKGKSELKKAVELEFNEKVAKVRNEIFNIFLLTWLKNIILFIGDGMSLPTVTAARTYKSQQQVRRWSGYITVTVTSQQSKADGEQLADYDGSSTMLSWEEFPHVGLSKVNFTLGLNT